MLMGVIPLVMGWIHVEWSSLPASVWWGVLYAGVVSTFIAQGTFNFAMRVLPVTISSLALTFQSVFSAVLGSLLLGESFTVWHAVGALPLLAGVVLVARARSTEQRAATQLVVGPIVSGVNEAEGPATSVLGVTVDMFAEHPAAFDACPATTTAEAPGPIIARVSKISTWNI